MLIAWISTAVVWINLSHKDRRSWSQISLWSSAESRANHHLINAHQPKTSCREEQRGAERRRGSPRLNCRCRLHLHLSSPLFQLAFSLISMHAVSSTRILLQEQRAANFSTSRATVPEQHSRLKKYKHYKKIILSPSCSLPLIGLCSSICLSPSLHHCENIKKTSAAPLPSSHTSLYHLHPNGQTASILSYQCILHLWSPIIAHPCFHLWYIYRKPPHAR